MLSAWASGWIWPGPIVWPDSQREIVCGLQWSLMDKNACDHPFTWRDRLMAIPRFLFVCVLAVISRVLESICIIELTWFGYDGLMIADDG